MRTLEDLNKSLEQIAAAMSDKGVICPRPKICFEIDVVDVWLHADSPIGGETCVNISAQSADEVIKKTLNYIKALPSAEEKAAHDFSVKLANVIDFGRDNGIDDEYIEPLRMTRKAMTENLLTVQS